VAVVNRSLLGLALYRQNTRLLYPALSWPAASGAGDPAGDLIQANLPQRPVYLAELWDQDFVSRFPVSHEGPLYRIVGSP
jgi:hypothetical protein